LALGDHHKAKAKSIELTNTERREERDGLQAIVGFKGCFLPQDLCL